MHSCPSHILNFKHTKHEKDIDIKHCIIFPGNGVVKHGHRCSNEVC